MTKRKELVKQNALVQADSNKQLLEERREALLKELNERICHMTGTLTPGLANRILQQFNAMLSWGPPASAQEQLAEAIDMIGSLKPANVTESLLAVQMVGVHNAAVKFLADATVPKQTSEGADANVLRATRLMRLFTAQLDAMARLKGKTGQQRVTVEHVNVHHGGQAIVGAINGSGERGRGDS